MGNLPDICRKPMIKVFYDVESTGTNYHKHSIHQLAGLIEIDDIVVDEFNIHTRPHPKAIIEKEALDVAGVTEEEILAYPDMKDCHKEFVGLISRYVNRYDRRSKAFLVGFNNRAFDDQFLRAWFQQNGDEFFGSYFYSDTRDALVLASEYLEDRRNHMPNFQLHSVAKELGLEVDQNRLHDASYDVELTRQIYRIVTNKDIEI